MPAVIYHKSGISDVSYECAEDTCLAYCQRVGLTVSAVYYDDSKDRTRWFEALARVTRTKEALVVHDLRQMARASELAIGIIAELARDGIRLISVDENWDTGTPTGRQMLRMALALADIDWGEMPAAQRRQEAKPSAAMQ